MRSPLTVLKNAATGFLDDDVLTLAGALTFSTLLSFAPMILIALWVTASLGFDVQKSLLEQIANLAGPEAASAATAVMASANKRPSVGSFAGIAGVGVAIVGATTAFAQLQSSLNVIWKIEPPAYGAIRVWFRRRLLSAGLLLAVAFVLCASLVMSAALGLLLSGEGVIWDILNQVISLAVFSALFAGLFRYLPDERLPINQAVVGGAVAASLFTIGKAMIGLYLAHGNVGGAYGAAGSLVVLLVWVYYSSTIFFFSAELVHAYRNAPSTNHQKNTFDGAA